jgi:hypothetical protein
MQLFYWMKINHAMDDYPIGKHVDHHLGKGAHAAKRYAFLWLLDPWGLSQESDRLLQLRAINRIEPNPNSIDMGDQIRIVDLLANSYVDFPRRQQIVIAIL